MNSTKNLTAQEIKLCEVYGNLIFVKNFDIDKTFIAACLFNSNNLAIFIL